MYYTPKNHRPRTFNAAKIPHPTDSISKKPITAMLCESAALYWSTSGTLALDAQKACMYLLAPKRSAAARVVGHMLREIVWKMPGPGEEETKRRYARAVRRETRHYSCLYHQLLHTDHTEHLSA